MRDISIGQNILYNVFKLFSSDRWKGFTVVKDAGRIQSMSARKRARDRDAVLGDLLTIIEGFLGLGWLYDTAFTLAQLNDPASIEIRVDGSGFNVSLSLIYSGEGGILDTIVYADTSLAIAL
jgi:hypothetical protein